jgi:nicotinate-nucleotide adenylyltransferase
MRIGIFGGTFDPVHLGHLIVAEQCREQANLDQIWFLPSARPPHKRDQALTPFAQRAEMLALAIAGHQAFRIDEIEKDRPGPSFTADTLEELDRSQPGNEWFLLVGSDTLADLPTWHEPARVVASATLLVAARPGAKIPNAPELRRALRLSDTEALRLQIIASPLIDISSRDLRRRAAEGRSLRYLVPRAVECYVEGKGLYRQGKEKSATGSA